MNKLSTILFQLRIKNSQLRIWAFVFGIWAFVFGIWVFVFGIWVFVLMKLHAVGLRGAHHLMPNELSGGMARRVALARSIALDPLLIMYDEPFTGLDPISLSVIGNLIRRLTDALGMTSIVVTHDVHESLKIVDYVYFIADGVIAAEGTPKEVRESIAPFVHQFVHGEEDGPVPFHYPAQTYKKDLNLEDNFV